jgi:hypothetical protein
MKNILITAILSALMSSAQASDCNKELVDMRAEWATKTLSERLERASILRMVSRDVMQCVFPDAVYMPATEGRFLDGSATVSREGSLMIKEGGIHVITLTPKNGYRLTTSTLESGQVIIQSIYIGK